MNNYHKYILDRLTTNYSTSLNNFHLLQRFYCHKLRELNRKMFMLSCIRE